MNEEENWSDDNEIIEINSDTTVCSDLECDKRKGCDGNHSYSKEVYRRKWWSSYGSDSAEPTVEGEYEPEKDDDDQVEDQNVQSPTEAVVTAANVTTGDMFPSSADKWGEVGDDVERETSNGDVASTHGYASDSCESQS